MSNSHPDGVIRALERIGHTPESILASQDAELGIPLLKVFVSATEAKELLSELDDALEAVRANLERAGELAHQVADAGSRYTFPWLANEIERDAGAMLPRIVERKHQLDAHLGLLQRTGERKRPPIPGRLVRICSIALYLQRRGWNPGEGETLAKVAADTAAAIAWVHGIEADRKWQRVKDNYQNTITGAKQRGTVGLPSGI